MGGWVGRWVVYLEELGFLHVGLGLFVFGAVEGGLD